MGEKQKHLNAKLDDKLQTPENVPRLFDLVQIPEKKVRVAFYVGLGDCLVVNNIEQATRIAYTRENTRFCKIVTTGGTIIQESGTISGGGDKLLSGKLRLNSVFDFFIQIYQYKEEILSLDKKIVKTETNLIICKEKYNKKVKLLNQLDKVKKSVICITNKLNMTLKTEQEMVNELNIQLRRILKNEIYTGKKELNRNINLTKEIISADTELTKLNEIESKLRKNIQKIEKKNEDKEGREQKNITDRLSHRINEIRISIVKRNVEAQNIVNKKTNISSKIETNLIELTNLEEKLNSNKKKIKITMKEKLIIKKKIAEMKTIKIKKTQKIDLLKNEIEKKI